MTDLQLYLAIGVPVLFNAAALGLVATLLMSHMNSRFDAIGKRFDDMRDLRRAERQGK